MRVLLKLPKEEKLNSLIAPFSSRISVGNMVVEIGRGSFNSIFRASFIGCQNVSKETLSLKIGDYCEFSENVKLIIGGEHLSNNFLINTFSGSPQIRSQLLEITNPKSNGLIEIGSSSILSSGVTVLSGVSIGDNVLIAAGSVCVKGNFNDNCIYGGVPAVMLKNLMSPKAKWWEYCEDDIVIYFQTMQTKSLTRKYIKKVEISYNGQPDRNGKIARLDMNGVYINGNFIALNALSAEVKEYFDQLKSEDNIIEISDEIFRSYIS